MYFYIAVFEFKFFIYIT